jgi:hypothetical protein
MKLLKLALPGATSKHTRHRAISRCVAKEGMVEQRALGVAVVVYCNTAQR